MNPKPRRTAKHDAALDSALGKLAKQEQKTGRKGGEPLGSKVRDAQKSST